MDEGLGLYLSGQEMDSSRFKRREIQTQRPSKQSRLASSDIIPSRSLSSPIKVKPSPVDSLSPVNIETATNVPTPPQLPSAENSELKVKQIQVVSEESSADETSTETKPEYPPMDMELPGGESQFRNVISASPRKKRLASTRRWAFRFTAAALVLLIGAGGFLFSQGYIKLHKVFKGSAATPASLTVNVAPNLLRGEGAGRINVLLLGRGGGNHDGPDLTDTMMLASIDPINHTSTLISIPRDLWVDVAGSGAMKINATWETGEFKYLGKIAPGSTDPLAIEAGFNSVDQVVESVIGVPINYNLLVDFDAFEQAVNTVGGVTINVPTELYDPTMAWQNHNNPILAEPGLQSFGGDQALNYVRSRETTSDFARSMRQRSVLMALKAKVDTLGTLSNPMKLAGLMSAFGNNVATDLSLSDAGRLYGIVKSINDSSVTSVGFADAPNHYVTTGMMGNQSIDYPTAGLFNYSDIQAFVRSQLPDGYILKENAKIMIYNGTMTPGLATLKANELKSYGYNVVGVANAPGNDWTQTVLVDLSHGKDKYTANYLQQHFSTTAETKLPANSSISPSGADFVIILGSDETTTPKT